MTVSIFLDPTKPDDYETFLKVKRLPRYSIRGHVAEIPDEYASLLGCAIPGQDDIPYEPEPFLFDYQRDLSALAIRKRKFAVFMEPGYGKTLIDFEFARHALRATGKRILLVAPPNVVHQMLEECERFYEGRLVIERVRANRLAGWICDKAPAIGITNYEAIREDTPRGNLGGLILSESSMLKSMYGKWGARLIEMGRGLDWKLCETGTPAPNDRIEYGNHAVFLDQFPNLNAFLAKYFVNRGQTDNRWELKPHALAPFYRELSHWCVFVNRPSAFGWKDNADGVPPIHVHIHGVELTEEQRGRVTKVSGDMYGTPGGITSRAKLSQLAKGYHDGEAVPTNKPEFIRKLVESWPDESTLIWCVYNREQDLMEKVFPDAASIRGDTPEDERIRLIADFQAGRKRILVSKGKVLGFGLNLQAATRQVFSGLVDSYETYYQCVKRSNRIGSTRPLNVHLPVTMIEEAMIATVLDKAKRVQHDAEEQERIFKECRYA